MDILIDTQSFIWFFEDNPLLPSSVRLRMERSSSLVVSIVSFWEMTIKANLGKLVIPETIAGVIDKALSNGFKVLQKCQLATKRRKASVQQAVYRNSEYHKDDIYDSIPH